MSGAWLIDKSALGRLPGSPDASLWSNRIERGLVHVSTPTLLEVGFSALNGPSWLELVDEPPVSLMPVANLTPACEARAVEVQRLLAVLGKHRAPSVPDLLISAIAEMSRLTVLHLDKDFDLIAEITGQPMEPLRL